MIHVRDLLIKIYLPHWYISPTRSDTMSVLLITRGSLLSSGLSTYDTYNAYFLLLLNS